MNNQDKPQFDWKLQEQERNVLDAMRVLECEDFQIMTKSHLYFANGHLKESGMTYLIKGDLKLALTGDFSVEFFNIVNNQEIEDKWLACQNFYNSIPQFHLK